MQTQHVRLFAIWLVLLAALMPELVVAKDRNALDGQPVEVPRRGEMTAASGAILLGPITLPTDQDATGSAEAETAAEGPRSCFPYKEKKRISIPKTFGAGRECYAAAYEESFPPEPFLFPSLPAWLCFWCEKGKKGRTCFEARSEHWAHQYVEGFFNKFEIVPLFCEREPREAILFTPASYGGGSGFNLLVTLWVYQKDCGQFVNILPEITVHRFDEYKLLSDPEGKLNGIMVVADYAPTAEESYQDLSSYRITIYRYSDKDKRFTPVQGGQFLTGKNYPAKLEGQGETEIIDEQMEKIRRVIEKNLDGRTK